MSISKEELQKEKAYLLKVKQVLEKLLEKGMQTVEQRTTSINDLKKFNDACLSRRRLCP